jgi:YggT family protein
MLHWLLDLYSLVLFVAVILSWINLPDDNPIVRVVRQLTEPVLAPLRKVIPPIAGLDLSPIILLLGIRLVQRLL